MLWGLMLQLGDEVTRPAVVERSRGQNLVRSGPEEGLISKECGVAYGVSGSTGVRFEIQK